MFKRKCPHCKNRIEKKFEYCPYCGKSLNNKRDYGLLGRTDSSNNMPNPMSNPFMEKMLNSALKMLEKQMKNPPKEPPKKSPLNIQFYVNGKKVTPKPNAPKKQVPQKIQKNIESKKEKRISKLPKKEPKSKLRRLSKSIIYEISIPGVKSLEDVMINQLENSIEIKALSKDKVYSKTLNINLPILNYDFNKGNLILELQAK